MEESFNVSQKVTTKQAILTVIFAYAALIVSQLGALLISQAAASIGLPKALCSAIAGILYIVFAYVCVSVICKKALKQSMNSCKIKKLSIKPIWCVSGLVLPFTIVAVYLLMAGRWEPVSMNTGETWYTIIDAVVFYGVAAGIVEEMIFRGVLMSALEQRWNRSVAIIIPSVMFALSHIIGADLNFISILQLLVAGSTVGIMFSLITYESGNIWNSAFVHAVWNMTIIGGILHIGVGANKNFLFNYVLESKSFAVTGGDFGIEASVIAIIGYALLSVLAVLLMKKKKL